MEKFLLQKKEKLRIEGKESFVLHKRVLIVVLDIFRRENIIVIGGKFVEDLLDVLKTEEGYIFQRSKLVI